MTGQEPAPDPGLQGRRRSAVFAGSPEDPGLPGRGIQGKLQQDSGQPGQAGR